MSRKESPHITSLRRQDRLNRLSAAGRMRVAGGQVERYEAEYASQDIEAAAQAEAHERFVNPQIGAIDARGIFLGVWTPTDREGNSLSQAFNAFAAPYNLPRAMEYDHAVSHIAGLKGWHGHDGVPYANDAELYEALKNGEYAGGWFVPPSDLLFGKDADGFNTMPDNILTHKDTGAFKGTFSTPGEGAADPEFYWSSTQPRGVGYKAHVLRLDNGYNASFMKERCRLSCRPVRLEPKP